MKILKKFVIVLITLCFVFKIKAAAEDFSKINQNLPQSSGLNSSHLHQWISCLNDESQKFVSEFLGFLNTSRISIEPSKLPSSLISEVLYVHDKCCQKIDLNKDYHNPQFDQFFYPGILLNLTKLFEDESRSKWPEFDKLHETTRESLLTHNQYVVFDFINFLITNYSNPLLPNLFIEFFTKNYGPQEKQFESSEDFEAAKNDFEQITNALRARLEQQITTKAIAQMSNQDVHDFAILLFDCLRIQKSEDFQDTSPNWLDLNIFDRKNILIKEGKQLSPVPADYTFHLLAGFNPYTCYSLSAYNFMSVTKQNITLLVNNEQCQLSNKHINTLLCRALTVTNLPSFTKNFDRSSPVRISLLGAPSKKIMPPVIDESNPVMEKSINSAQTWEQGIAIMRNEEASKTLIHELLHVIQLDKNVIRSSLSLAMQTNRLYEALVESMACMINIILTSAEHCKEINMCENSPNITQQMWQIERTFGLYQAAKLLVAAEFDKFEDFFNSESKKMVYQKAAAAEYHILKAILLHDPTRLFNATLATYDQKQTAEKERSPLEAALDGILQENSKIIAPLMDKIMQSIRTSNHNDSLGQTARMTIIERKLL